MKFVCMCEVKSGGHISIPKIYPPDLISMKQFNHIEYHKEKETLDVGAGVIWKDVYKYLETFASDDALGVVGGDPLIGVSGWLLGGGYSLQTNRFGLGIDNIVGFRVLLPGAKVVCNVNHEENPEMFKALKGGGHNFGIVTQFTLRVHHHAKRTNAVASGECPEFASSTFKDLLVSFIENETPPEVVVVASFRHDLKDGELKSRIPWCVWLASAPKISLFRPDPFRDLPGTRDLAQFFFSGAPQSGSDDQREDPQSMSLAEVYEAFSLRHLPVSLETLQTDSHFVHLDSSLEILEECVPPGSATPVLIAFSHSSTLKAGDLIERKLYTSLREGNKIDRDSLRVFTAGNKTVVTERSPDLRGRMACILVSTFTRPLLDEAEKQAKELSGFMKENQGIRASFEIWPFHKDSFNGVGRKDTAWPHEEGKVTGPLIGWFEWSGAANDEFWLKKIEAALEELRKVALKEKCTTEDLPMYLNTTLENTLVKDIYRDNYEWLKGLRRQYDQNNVMGLAAGFVIDASEE